MLERFAGDGGRRLRIEAFTQQRIVQGNVTLADELADRAILKQVEAGQVLIEQNESTNEVFFILSGSVNVIVNGRTVAVRGAGNHVGEMAAIEPTQRRSATVTAKETTVVAEIKEEGFSDVASRYPELYKFIARELSRRLLERNRPVSGTREKI